MLTGRSVSRYPLPLRRWGRLLAVFVLAGGGLLSGGTAFAQQKIGYVDTEYVLNQMPEYSTVQQRLDKLEKQWRTEIQGQEEKVQKLEQEFQARELLYTEQERKQKQQAIRRARKRVEELRQKYFGPDGELYSRQEELMRSCKGRINSSWREYNSPSGPKYF